MKSKRLARLDKRKLIELIIRKDETIELQEKRCDSQIKVGQIIFEGKKYNVIFEREQ